MTSAKRLSLLAAALVLAGCASVSPDGLRGDVQQQTQSRLPTDAQLPSVDANAKADEQQRIGEWLRKPVDQDTAVRIALLNNPDLQTQLASLAIEDAERAQALTLFNPTLTLGRFTNAHEREIERELAFGLVNIITLPWRSRWLGWQMERATLQASQNVLTVAADTRRAWLRAVAAEQTLEANEKMNDAAQLGAELARRMAVVGNFNKLQQARELAIAQESAAQLSRARLNATLEREQLARLMGLWGTQTAFALPKQLPAIPKTASELRSGDDAEATALRERLDLRALRRDLDVTADRGGWSRVGAVFGDIGVTYSNNRATDRESGHVEKTRGWELELPLPIFDWGGSASARTRAEVQRSAAQLQSAALRARSESRTNWARYRTAWDLAHQQQAEVLPLAKQVQDETVLRYNGMFDSVWQLLAQARTTTQAVVNATNAQRDFWLAETDLQLALTGTSPGNIAPVASSTSNNSNNNESGGH
ncbi:TolC family protein [Diaphorobacter sp. HDW4B]|uniref:TolC family protein n=1 Tax=Diaphorobacter sp. HDW4B TaxID=2714925 RepID=UPI00140B53B7|nr:TolC family protein [Diaphorobacter sp. HDW4B]QIL72496.1 TolC family protein [Diaphorobacter sp. HDW4B]